MQHAEADDDEDDKLLETIQQAHSPSHAWLKNRLEQHGHGEQQEESEGLLLIVEGRLLDAYEA